MHDAYNMTFYYCPTDTPCTKDDDEEWIEFEMKEDCVFGVEIKQNLCLIYLT